MSHALLLCTGEPVSQSCWASSPAKPTRQRVLLTLFATAAITFSISFVFGSHSSSMVQLQGTLTQPVVHHLLGLVPQPWNSKAQHLAHQPALLTQGVMPRERTLTPRMAEGIKGTSWLAMLAGGVLLSSSALLAALITYSHRPSQLAVALWATSSEKLAVDAAKAHKIPSFLNKTPHLPEVREYFYNDALDSLLKALAAGETRMEMKTIFPETNTESDVYRVGTMLELVRHLATELARQGKRVKICVQQYMGEGIFSGLPLALAGMMKLAKLMDWDEEAVGDRISFGEVGADQVKEEDDVFLLISPQNITGCSIIELLEGMCNAAKDKPIVIINPKLTDILSSSGVMSFRGREERMAFASTFKPIHHFRLLYKKPYFYPIYGALRMSYGGPWAVYKRIGEPTETEEYRFSECFPTEPNPDQITDAVLRKL